MPREREEWEIDISSIFLSFYLILAISFSDFFQLFSSSPEKQKATTLRALLSNFCGILFTVRDNSLFSNYDFTTCHDKLNRHRSTLQRDRNSHSLVLHNCISSSRSQTHTFG
jgi:hypothetical protein